MIPLSGASTVELADAARRSIVELAEPIRHVLDAIDTGAVDASPAQTAYVRGVLDTLDALAAARPVRDRPDDPLAP